MDNKSDKMWKEAVVAHFDKLFGRLLEITGKPANNVNQYTYAVCEPSLKPMTF
jgi:hypothetical protein